MVGTRVIVDDRMVMGESYTSSCRKLASVNRYKEKSVGQSGILGACNCRKEKIARSGRGIYTFETGEMVALRLAGEQDQTPAKCRADKCLACHPVVE